MRPRMSNRGLTAVVFAACLGLGAVPARAQSADPYTPGRVYGRVAVGGDVTILASPRDDRAFFNYTDYELNALRMVRLRGLGEFRPHRRLSFVGELRVEDLSVSAAALFVRWRPFGTETLEVQAGRIPPVFGAFPRRAYGRDNAVLGTPLAYQYLTSLRPDALPAIVDDLLRMRGRGWQPSYPIGSSAVAPGLPLVSASKWDTGVQVTYHQAWLQLAGAVSRGSPAAPVVRDQNDGLAISGRAAAMLPGGVVLGVSGARGQWIDDSVLALVSPGGHPPASQSVFGVDGEAGFEHWVVRAEWLHSAFELPIVLAHEPNRTIRAHSGFVELRYRPWARWQFGVRVERLLFGPVYGTLELQPPQAWEAKVDRVEGVLGYRVTRHVELRGGWQENWRDGGRVHQMGYPTAALMVWF